MRPSSDGPTNPPRLPTELISPMLPAAAASVKNRLGSAQNAGMYAFNPRQRHGEKPDGDKNRH